MRHLVLIAVLLAGSQPAAAKPGYLRGSWGGPHVVIVFEGALANIQYDCASGTIDSIVQPAKDGRFAAKGTHRPGQGGPIRVGQIFTSVQASYVGEVQKDRMTFSVTLEDGTVLGPFTVTQNAAPQITRCL
jgi:hypothetical protein